MNKPSERIVVFVTPAQKRAIAASAEQLGISVSELMRRAVLAYGGTADQVKADAANNKVLGVEELDKLTRDGTIDKWLKGMNDYFVEAGKLKQPVDPKKYYTGDLFIGAGK